MIGLKRVTGFFFYFSNKNFDVPRQQLKIIYIECIEKLRATDRYCPGGIPIDKMRCGSSSICRDKASNFSALRSKPKVMLAAARDIATS